MTISSAFFRICRNPFSPIVQFNLLVDVIEKENLGNAKCFQATLSLWKKYRPLRKPSPHWDFYRFKSSPQTPIKLAFLSNIGVFVPLIVSFTHQSSQILTRVHKHHNLLTHWYPNKAQLNNFYGHSHIDSYWRLLWIYPSGSSRTLIPNTIYGCHSELREIAETTPSYQLRINPDLFSGKTLLFKPGFSSFATRNISARPLAFVLLLTSCTAFYASKKSVSTQLATHSE